MPHLLQVRAVLRQDQILKAMEIQFSYRRDVLLRSNSAPYLMIQYSLFRILKSNLLDYINGLLPRRSSLLHNDDILH